VSWSREGSRVSLSEPGAGSAWAAMRRIPTVPDPPDCSGRAMVESLTQSPFACGVRESAIHPGGDLFRSVSVVRDVMDMEQAPP
jgi:hypothetical protein